MQYQQHQFARQEPVDINGCTTNKSFALSGITHARPYHNSPFFLLNYGKWMHQNNINLSHHILRKIITASVSQAWGFAKSWHCYRAPISYEVLIPSYFAFSFVFKLSSYELKKLVILQCLEHQGYPYSTDKKLFTCYIALPSLYNQYKLNDNENVNNHEVSTGIVTWVSQKKSWGGGISVIQLMTKQTRT